MKKIVLISLIIMMAAGGLSAQNVEKTRRVATRSGNKALEKGNVSQAVTSYRKALRADSTYSKAQYNAGVAHGKLQQYDTAVAYYQKVINNGKASDDMKSRALYNAGNIYLRQALAARDQGQYDAKSLQAAVESYKASLKLDSKNNDAKHNLSLAMQLLRQQQQNGGGQNQDQQNQQNQQSQQNQDQQDQQNQQNQDQQNQQNQNKQDQNQQGNDKKDQQQNQNGQKKQDDRQQEQRRREAEQMLNAMKNNEQQTMKAVKMREAQKERRQGTPVKIEKDW